MQVINIHFRGDIPKDYTGIAEYLDGTKLWLLNGKRHRIDGPAVEWSDGSKYWYLNGKRHREDGPAIEYPDGAKEWYLNGEPIFEIYTENHFFLFVEELIDEEGKRVIKVLTQEGVEIWPNLPGLKELADNWEKK